MKPSKSRGVPKRNPTPRGDSVRPFNIHLLSSLALIALTLLAYSNSFQGGFVLDNRGLLLNDPRIREATLANLRLILDHSYWWPTGEAGLYRPFTTLSYLFNHAILGNRDQPLGWHAINFLLHAGNVLLVYALAMRLFRRVRLTLFIAALWAVHPVLTESVTNIAGRADLLAAAAVLGSLLLYLRSAETNGWPRIFCLAGLALVTAVGVFSKESAAIIPGVILVFEFTFRKDRKWGQPQLVGLLVTFVPVALMLWQRSRVLSAALPMEIPFTDNPIVGANLLIGRLTAIKVIARCLWLTAWPVNLSADYSWSQIPLVHGSLADWIACLAILALFPGMFFLYRRSRPVFFVFCLGLIWLAPSSNLLFPVGTIMAERFLYLPALGLAACMVSATYTVAERARAVKYAPVVLGLLIAAFAARTAARNADWRDNFSMATALVRASPRSFKTHDLLANVLFEADPSHSNIDRVIEESEKSRAILDPLPDSRNQPDPYRFAATCYMYKEAWPQAIAALRRYLAIERTSVAEFKNGLSQGDISVESVQRGTNLRQADAWLLLSEAYLKVNQGNKAADAVAHARPLDPLNPQLYRQMAVIASAADRLDDAAVALIEGAFITSDRSLRQNLVELYQKAMDPRSCTLTPGPNGPAINPSCAVVHNHLCAAASAVVQTLSGANQQDLAQSRKQMFTQQFGCHP